MMDEIKDIVVVFGTGLTLALLLIWVLSTDLSIETSFEIVFYLILLAIVIGFFSLIRAIYRFLTKKED